MAVGDFLRPQRSPLSVYDEQMAQLLRQQSAGIGARDIAAESTLGFPVGTMTAKILGNVLAGAKEKRAINRDAQQKRARSLLASIARGDLPENVTIDDEGNFTTRIKEAQRIEQPPEELQQSTYGRGLEGQMAGVPAQVIPEVTEKGMVLKGNVNDPNLLERTFFGDIGSKKILNERDLIDASNIDAFAYDEFKEQKRRSNLPTQELMQVFDDNNNIVYLNKVFNPKTQTTSYLDRITGNPVDITKYSGKKFDLATKSYQVTDMDGNTSTKLLTNNEVANLLDEGIEVIEASQAPETLTQKFENFAEEIVQKNATTFKIDQNTGNVIDYSGKIEYYHPSQRPKINTEIDINLNQEQEQDPEIELMEKMDKEGQNALIDNQIKTFQTSNQIINLEEENKTLKARLNRINPGGPEGKGLISRIKENNSVIKDQKNYLKDKRLIFKTDTNLMRNIKNSTKDIERDVLKIRSMITRLIEQDNPPKYNEAKAQRPGTLQYNIMQQIEVMRGRIGFKTLQDMRNSNKTGGGVGNLSEKELAVLMGTKGVINIADLDTTLETIIDFADQVKTAQKQDEDWYKETYGREFE